MSGPQIDANDAHKPPVRCFLLPHAHVEFQLPALRPVLLNAPQFQGPHFGHRRLEVHRGELSRGWGLAGQRRLDGGQLLQILPPGHVLEHCPDLVIAPDGRGEEAEAGGLAGDEAELLGRDIRLRALLHAEGGHAQRLDGGLHAGHRGHRGLHADIVGPGGAAADAQAMALADPSIIGRAPGHGEVQIRPLQLLGGRAAIRGEPSVEHLHDPGLERARLEDAPVEEDGGGVEEGLAAHVHRCIRGVGERLGLPREEGGQVTGDPRVLGVGQRHLGQAGAARGAGQLRDGRGGKEAIGEQPVQLLPGQLRAQRAADERRAPARNGDGGAAQGGIRVERLLGLAAAIGQGVELPRIELLALGGQLLGQGVGQRQVHVVAAQQDVVSHGHADQLHLSLPLAHGDDGEVRGAAAHIHHEDDLAGLHLLPEGLALRFQPRIERRLGLLQQGEVRDASGLRGLQRQLACRGIERGGDGDDDVLGGEGAAGLLARAGEGGVPRLTQGGAGSAPRPPAGTRAAPREGPATATGASAGPRPGGSASSGGGH
ncbi:conserved hypothetical protein, partial [Stigmatella aurantiaca DW4/3-1]